MTAAAAILVAAACLIAGCGDDATESSPAEETDVTIALDADGPGGAPAEEAQLACPGANAPQQACSAVEELPDDPAAPVSPQTPCTEIYGGADAVTIEGTLSGEPVDARLTRENGCEIERFDRFVPLLAVLFPDYEPGSAISG